MTYEETLKLYEQLVATHPEAERKGDTMPYTSLNGHMYSYLSKDCIVALRLPEPIRTAFIEKYKAKLMEAYGIVQKEYVAIPNAILKKTAELKPYFAQSFDYINTLKPKPTTKGKKK